MRGNLKSKTGVVNCAAQVFVGQATKKYEDNRLTIFGASAARWPDFVSSKPVFCATIATVSRS